MAFNARQRILRISIGIFLGIIALYALFQTRDLIFGARLKILRPSDGMVVHEQLILIEGQMKHAASVSIDNNPVDISQDGHFSEQLLLAPGYNIITIAARDRFGALIEKTYRVLYNEAATSE